MKRRMSPAVIAAVLALMAFPATAAFATSADSDVTPSKPTLDVAQLAKAKAAADVPAIADEVIKAAQADLKLSAGQVVTKLTAEHRAGKMNEVFARTLGGSYAGGWMNQQTGKLVVGVTDAATAAVVRDAGATAKVVRHSEADLNAMVAKLDAAASPATVTSWYPDVTTNSVVLVAKPGNLGTARDFARAAGLDPAAVRVVSSSATPRTFIDVVGGNAYYIGGSSRCSVGFSVPDGFVTAGHCGNAGSSTSQPSGQFAGSSFPGNDYGYVRVSSGNTPVGAVNNYSGGRVAVAGSTDAAVGSTVCRSGSTTGWHCGTIQARNTSVTYPQGTVSGLIRTNVCAEPGDSGGSLIAGSQAQGMTSGGSGNCSSGGTTYFQPVNEALQAYGLSLLTSNGGEQPPGESCDSGDFTGSRTLSQGQEAYEPDDTYYTVSSSGTHTACLDGPDGADFDLYLLKWNGSSWATVASGTTPSDDEQISYNGTSGSYTYAVYAYRGSGSYTLELSTP